MSDYDFAILAPDMGPEEYYRLLQIDWHEVYRNLHRLDDFYQFADSIKAWMKK